MSKTKKNKPVLKFGRKSLRGEYGQVGAPPKETKWPNRPFLMEQLFERNSTGPHRQCKLSLRNKVNKLLINPPGEPANPNGTIYQLVSIPQAHGAVGRPKSRYVMKEHYDAATMVLIENTPAKDTTANVKPKAKGKKSRKAKATATVITVQDAQPATPPVTPAQTPQVAVPAAPPAPIEVAAPATPAPIEVAAVEVAQAAPAVQAAATAPVAPVFA